MIDALTQDLSNRIREARQRANLSQREMAALLGVSERTLQGWEYGVIPQPRHRRRLAEFMTNGGGNRGRV